ncbi:hypothetical protein CBX59_001950 [Salmonella enterica]|nr:hypothetical protein [Salmonella enterica]
MKQTKPKGVTVALDAEISLALNQARNEVIEGLNKSGFNGLAMAPSLGAMARMSLRKALGLPENKQDDMQA